MNRIISFFQLIRWPNLVFIFLTQSLFYFFVFPFCYKANDILPEQMKLTTELFFLLSIASVLIAAAGYIINDYFDINIDQINKAAKVIIGQTIHRRFAILWHAVLSVAGIVLSAYVGRQLQNVYLPLFNTLVVFLLVFYSTTFKKKLLIGNVIISFLTAWVIFVLTVAEFRYRSGFRTVWLSLLKFSILYGGFAFILSLIREALKDMEDLTGDRRYGCTTMPVVWGVSVSKVYTGVWIIVLAGMVGILCIYIIPLGWWIASLYGIVFLLIPVYYLLRKLQSAVSQQDFHHLSSIVKWIMLAGILSMLFFKII